jgi:hypothetical protein
MNEVYSQRHKRLQQLCSHEPEDSAEMAISYTISNKIIQSIRHSTQMFLFECLSEFYDREYEYQDSIEALCDAYSEDIKSLPNITPNGLMMSKRETACSYNSILRSASKLVKYLGLDKTCEKIHFPVNIRIRWGNPSEYQLSRPYASTKWHSDIWAGESAENVMLHTPIFGDFIANGISVAQNPLEFFPNYVKSLNDFDDASDLVSNLKEHDFKMNVGNSYLLDSFLLHKTKCGADSLRGILSFPLVPKKKLDSDIFHNPKRDENYLLSNEWVGVGKDLFVVTEEKLEPYKLDDVTKTSYAGKYKFLS